MSVNSLHLPASLAPRTPSEELNATVVANVSSRDNAMRALKHAKSPREAAAILRSHRRATAAVPKATPRDPDPRLATSEFHENPTGDRLMLTQAKPFSRKMYHELARANARNPNDRHVIYNNEVVSAKALKRKLNPPKPVQAWQLRGIELTGSPDF